MSARGRTAVGATSSATTATAPAGASAGQAGPWTPTGRHAQVQDSTCKMTFLKIASFTQDKYWQATLFNAPSLSHTDVNECAQENGGCAQICTNEPGGFSCSCEPGFELSPADLKTCQGARCEHGMIRQSTKTQRKDQEKNETS